MLYQGDLNVAHTRALDAWGTTDAQFGRYAASGRTREEAAAFDELLRSCGLVDGFRALHPTARSGTCWAQKREGEAEPREYWKRYDYALVSRALLEDGHSCRSSHSISNRRGKGRGEGSSLSAVVRKAELRLVQVRHRADAFAGGRPDHLPVESVFTLARC